MGLRIILLAGLALGLGGTASLSCIVSDTEYCADDSKCPLVQTDLGMQRLLCHPTLHVCVMPSPGNLECFKDDECMQPHSPRCDQTTHICTGCRVGDATDTSCQHLQDLPICANAPDGSGTTVCVNCQVGSDCPKETPICDPLSWQCRKCTAHTDCQGDLRCDDGMPCTDSLVCIDDESLSPALVGTAGRCAQNGANGHVVYVNPQDSSCSMTATSAGLSFSAPLCTLALGFDKAAALQLPYIRVVGQGLLPQPTLTTGTYAVIGAPTKSTSDRATVTTIGAAFDVGGTASLTVDGMNINSMKQGSDTVVQCVGGIGNLPTLKLRRSVVTGGAQPAANSDPNTAAVVILNCNATIDQNVIGVTAQDKLTNGSAHGTAIYISDSIADGKATYLIQDNLIAGNLGAAINLNSMNNPNFVIRFNTIIGNGRMTQGSIGAVLCPRTVTIKEFSHSIVLQNATVGGAQIDSSGRCNVQDVVVGSQAMGTDKSYTVLDAHLDNTFHFQTGADNSCCIDKVTPTSGQTLPSQDVYGIARPQGAAWDIGAVEQVP